MKLLVVCALFSLLAAVNVMAQEFSSEEVLQGYSLHGDSVTFLFDSDLYELSAPVHRVVVTGSFAGWNQSMEDSSRTLQKLSESLWSLTIANAEYLSIPPSSEFKFRINAGDWLSPPASAPNTNAGNLVFLKGVTPRSISAMLLAPRAVEVTFKGDGVVRSLNPADYFLEDGSGRRIAVEHIAPNTLSETLVVPAEDLDIRRVYYLHVEGFTGKALCRRDAWFKTLYSGKYLGARVDTTGSTTFRIFSPRADRIRLFLYDGPNEIVESPREIVEMIPDNSGVWEAVLNRDLTGSYYDFTVHGPKDPGNFFYDTHPVHISDPYSRANVDAFGRSRVVASTTAASPLANGRPAMKDVIAYEVHIQDFTDRLPVDDTVKGTFRAMTVPGLTNTAGQKIGFDHLIDLGINVVHLMPVQEYLHYPDDEWQEAFKDDPYMTEQGVNLENYQWGYRTTHAFAIENRFRSRDSDYGDEREQFRDLVQAFHDKGIAVIIDIVPNHTGENMDGRNYLFNFNVLDKPYYYRTNSNLEHIGPFGNEVKTEMRPMVQRWVIDQCVELIEQFGIDGFRIDLAGQIDEQTLIALRNAVGDDVIIYGEPWIAPTDPEVRANPDWAWYKEDSPITYFQDSARNAFKGPVSDPRDPVTDRGFPGGDGSVRGDVMRGLANTFEDERRPDRGINYLDIHDNWALADRFATTDWDGRFGVEEERFKIAATLLFTSLGPIVLHGGTELMRSKGHAPLQELKKVTRSGELAYHGKNDTYNLRIANQFIWENKGKSKASGASANYDDMYKYWRGLIALRNSDVGAVLRVGEAQADDYYTWILPQDDKLLGYVITSRILVLINTSDVAARFDLGDLEEGDWQLVANGTQVDHVNGVSAPYQNISARSPVDIPATTAAIWIRR